MKKERFKIVPAVYLILKKGNKILLSRRFKTGYHDGDYSFPAGHLDGGERLIQAMTREAKEEIGIKLNSKDLKFVHAMHRKGSNNERADFFFIVEKWRGVPKIMESHKCDDLHWYPINNLPANTIPYIKQAIDCFRKKIFYSEIGW